jgi:hypothetical protein
MANSNGGGAHCTYGGVLTNCIVWRNKKAGVFEQIYATSGTLIIPKYCAVQDGYTGAGNINLDSTNTGTTSGKFYPYFVSPTTFTGVATNAGDSLIIANADWRIIGTSACVDKGIADTTGLNLPLIDLAENQRILNSRIDIGSYEFNGLLQTITWTQSLADISMGLGNMELTAVASSDLPVAYVSDNLSVARVSNDTLYFLGPGTANITAKQEGNGMYFPATNVIKTINVLNNDATLSYLTVSESTLTPAFSSSITQYSINVCPDIISISITATANDINASFIGNITDYSLPATDTTFIINVIAEDGITIEDYKIDILHVPTYFIPLAVTICKGKFFSFGGNTLTTSGVYYDSLTTVNGCDSIIELTLTVIPSYFIPLAETICNGESFSFGGNSLTASGVYYDSLTTMNGCDSIYELTLMVNSVYEMLVSASITQGESYNFFDTNLTTAGEYKHTLQSIHGCDSVIILTLTITTSIIEVETNSTLQIYPNPTKGQLTMDNGQLTMEYVEIYDISGRKLQTIKVLETSKVLDVSHLANGIYLIKVKTKQGETMRKIVKKTNNE